MRPLSTQFLVLLSLSTAALAQQGSPVTVDLKGAVALALRENPSVSSARYAAQASSARLDSAKSVRGFNLSVKSNYGYINEETSFNGIPILEKNTLTSGLIFEKLVYSGGKVESAIKQAKEGQTAAAENAATAKDEVTVRVAEAYYKVKMAKEGINAARESVKALEASHDSAVKLREAGMVTKADILRTEVELAAANERLLNAENNHQIALAALKTAVGLDQDSELELADNPTDIEDIEPEKLEPHERHDIAGMKAALSASEAGIRTAISDSRPQVFVQLDAQRIVKGAFFPRNENTAAFGVAVKMPIWDSGAARANVSEAHANRDKMEQDLRALIQMSQLEAKSAELNLQTARARIKTTETQVSAAEESLRVLQAGYAEGITPITDVLDAQSALVNARFNRIATHYDIQVAQVRYLAAIGRADILQP